MENKELKAIDANEKKKIAKLNQSTILPGSVRIKVHTLEPQEIIPQDEELPAIVTAEELEEDETEEVEEVQIDIEGKTWPPCSRNLSKKLM